MQYVFNFGMHFAIVQTYKEKSQEQTMKKNMIFASLALIAAILAGMNHAYAYDGGNSHSGINHEYEDNGNAYHHGFGHGHRGHGDCYYGNAQ